MDNFAALATLFAFTFGAATVLPIASEIIFSGMLMTSKIPVWLLVMVASIGNTLGACVNWVLGRLIEQYGDRPWFPVSKKALEKAQGWYLRWGVWSLLLSWAPVIGDPLTFAAGILKTPFLIFITIVAVAKTGRYVALAWLFV
ncbi:MAG: YqaA family protein [Geminicoccaceae bacterium]